MFGLTGEPTGGLLAFITGLPGHWEIVIVLMVILLLFGGKKLPELAKGLGRGLRLFKRELKGMKEDVEADAHEKKQDQGSQDQQGDTGQKNDQQS